MAPPPPFGALRSHSLDTPHSVGVLWTSDRPNAETSTSQHITLTRDKHPNRWWDSNPESQQVSGRKPTTSTARSLESVILLLVSSNKPRLATFHIYRNASVPSVDRQRTKLNRGRVNSAARHPLVLSGISLGTVYVSVTTYMIQHGILRSHLTGKLEMSVEMLNQGVHFSCKLTCF
jgi:hypothetical protein